MIANSKFTLDIKERNGRKKFTGRNPEDKIISTGTISTELLKTIIPIIITNSIFLTTRKRCIILNEDDKAFVEKTFEDIIKKLKKNGIANLPSNNPNAGINVVKKGRKYYFAFDDGEIVGPPVNTF